MVRSEPAPVDVKVTVPAAPAAIGPLTVIDPIEAMAVILPAALVVMTPMVKLPVNKVKLKFRLLAVTVVKVRFEAVEATV